jgi:L-ascorbate metabolism protein UlaG (beta-lactamase superfamily)
MTARLNWYCCATFRLTVGSLVLFLDAYIDRIPGAAGTGLRADDIERADWIVVGHSHFDHLWGAERIAKRTGATIIGSHETVRIMEQEGVPLAQLLPVGGGERIRLSYVWPMIIDYRHGAQKLLGRTPLVGSSQ